MVAYQATNNSTMSYYHIAQRKGMKPNLYHAGTTKPINSKHILTTEIFNNDYCKKKMEEELLSSVGIVHRNDIGANCYECQDIQKLIDLVNKIAKQDREKHEKENNRNHEEQQETQNKRQKTTHNLSIDVQFKTSNPLVFNPGKVTIKSAGVKRTIYPQQKF
jgi:hypothetical protein